MCLLHFPVENGRYDRIPLMGGDTLRSLLLMSILITATPAQVGFERTDSFIAALSADRASASALRIFAWDPTQARPLPLVTPLDATAEVDIIDMDAAPGEFQPASLVLRATHSDITGIRVSAGSLTGPGGKRIDSTRIDIRIVKSWYQSGYNSILTTPEKYLLAELLLKDDALVQVDHGNRTDTLRLIEKGETRYFDITSKTAVFPAEAALRDATTLQPFDAPAHLNRQIWLTVHVPEDAPAGTYTGTLTINAPGLRKRTVRLRLKVLPFQLAPPAIEYSLYYRGTYPGSNVIGSEHKSEAQLAAELADMRDHGVLYPTVYQNPRELGRFLQIMKSVGLPADKLYYLGVSTGAPATPGELASLHARVREVIDIATRYGFSNVHIYGIDEAVRDVIGTERDAFREVHAAGAKVFVAVNSTGGPETVGGLLDVAVTAGSAASPEQLASWRAAGTRVYSYGNPQVGVENPDIYRRNYGLGLFLAGYDGAMDYAYQHSFGHIWNDFDDPVFRDHVFAYPTSSGVIDTIQWEGFREGVDDVRYLSTLIQRDSRTPDQIRTWLKGVMNANPNLSDVRKIIIQEILRLGRTAEGHRSRRHVAS